MEAIKDFLFFCIWPCKVYKYAGLAERFTLGIGVFSIVIFVFAAFFLSGILAFAVEFATMMLYLMGGVLADIIIRKM